MKLIALIINLFAAVFTLFPQQKKIVLVSRQSARPFDFRLMEPELSKRFPGYEIKWVCVSEIGGMSVGLMLRQLWHVSTAAVVLADGYVPAVSIPKKHRALHIQMWHAMGAIKKFGYQCLDTPAGRSSSQAEVFRMHRGYDYVIAALSGLESIYVEAFDVDCDRIVALGLPRNDYLIHPSQASYRKERIERAKKNAQEMSEPVILYAPTFRKNNGDDYWFAKSVERLAETLLPLGATLLVAGHPLQMVDREKQFDTVKREAEKRGFLDVTRDRMRFLAETPAIDAISLADYVVTDYSAVAFEAGLAGKPVLFYVSDIDHYRKSPGLNIDPIEAFPGVSFTKARYLAEAIRSGDVNADTSFSDAMEEWCKDLPKEGAVNAICALIETRLKAK